MYSRCRQPSPPTTAHRVPWRLLIPLQLDSITIVRAPVPPKGALKQALHEQGATKLTSIDQKIQRRLQENERYKMAAQKQQPAAKVIITVKRCHCCCCC